MDEEDFDYVPSYVRDRQPSVPLNTVYRPVDRGLAERLYKMFRPTFNDNWKMPDLSGPEYSQTPPGPGFNENSGGNPYRTMEYRVGRDDKGNPVQYASATGSGQNGDGGSDVSGYGVLGGKLGSTYQGPNPPNTPFKDTFWENQISPRTMRPSENLAGYLKTYEEFRDKPYNPTPNDPLTIGYGHVILPGENFSGGITEEQALKLFQKDLEKHAAIVDEWASRNNVKLTQNQYDALVSFVYNMGSIDGDGTETIGKTIKCGNASPEEIRRVFGLYNSNADGVQEGLIKRRRDEADMFLNGDYRRKINL